MLIEDIKTVLAETGLPVTYYQWPEENVPELPYLVWYFPNSNNFVADDCVYQRIERLNVELYADPRDFATEQTVEAVLDEAGFVWEKSCTFINSEHMYDTLYEMDVLILPTPAEAEETP